MTSWIDYICCRRKAPPAELYHHHQKVSVISIGTALASHPLDNKSQENKSPEISKTESPVACVRTVWTVPIPSSPSR